MGNAAMRLNSKEKDVIAREDFAPDAAIFLLGSRVDDTKRGGDSDLLVELPEALAPAELVEHRTRFVSRLYRALDEQCNDIVIITAYIRQDPRPVVSAARQTGVLQARA